MSLAGAVAVVTGGSRGIGAAVVRSLLRDGAKVYSLSRTADDGAAGLDEQGDYTWLATDLTDEDAVNARLGEILAGDRGVQVLVNNAGFAAHRTVADSPMSEIEEQVSVNFLGAVRCTKEFLPGMLARGSGHVVNVASAAASMGLPGIAAYCASKSAMLGFSEGLRHELHGTGVGVTVVSPIMVRTEFFAKMPRVEASRFSLHPRTVARAIVRASGSPRLEIVVPWPARAAIWLKQAVPYTVAPLAGRMFKKYL